MPRVRGPLTRAVLVRGLQEAPLVALQAVPREDGQRGEAQRQQVRNAAPCLQAADQVGRQGVQPSTRRQRRGAAAGPAAPVRQVQQRGAATQRWAPGARLGASDRSEGRLGCDKAGRAEHWRPTRNPGGRHEALHSSPGCCRCRDHVCALIDAFSHPKRSCAKTNKQPKGKAAVLDWWHN